MKIEDLIEIKSVLNKYAGLDNIERYYYPTVKTMYNRYIQGVEENEGKDPGFPDMILKFN